MPDLSHVRTWIFDLDNTLYPPEARLFDQIEERMTRWVMQALGVDDGAADRLRRRYWERYGTTLAGLMAEHGIDPDLYLENVHDIALDGLSPDPDLARAIATLPGRRVVFTNGSAAYAGRVLSGCGLADSFDAVYGIEDAGYRCKPAPAAFEAILRHEAADPARSAMFEDVARNLVAPHAMGMATILVAPRPGDGRHIDHHAADLTGFLTRIAASAVSF